MTSLPRILVASSAILAVAVPARGALFVEYFDYGTTAVSTDPLNLGTATGGWGGGWNRVSAGGNTATYVTSNLSYTATGYEASGNAGTGSIGRLNNTPEYHRSFAEPLVARTIWVSALIQGNRSDGTTRPRVHLVGPGGEAEFGFADSGASPDNLATANVAYAGFGAASTTSSSFYNGAVFLLLAKLEIDADGPNDRLTVWINPDVSTVGTLGEAGIAGSSLVLQGVDGVGSSITAAGFSFGRNLAFMDALRISTTGGDDGLGEVLTGVAIPEPGSAAMLAAALAAGAAVVHRSRRRR